MLMRGRRERCLSGVVWSLLLAGVTSCGLAESDAPRTTESESSEASETTESPDQSGSDEAKSAVHTALARWMKADTGSFTQTTTYPDGSMTTSGVYRMSTRTSRSSAAIESSDQHFDVRLIGIRDTNYMNMAWPGGLRRCWLRMTLGSIGKATGLETVGGAGGLPANVVALSYARGLRTSPDDDGQVIGTVDLVSAASMFGSGIVKLFDDTTLAAPIGAEFTIVDGEIVTWSITGQSLLVALDRAGLMAGVSDEIRNGLLEVNVEVEYDQVGSAEVAVRPPDRAHVMSGEQFESHEGCAAAR